MSILFDPNARQSLLKPSTDLEESTYRPFAAAPAQFALPMPLLEWSPFTDVPKALTGSIAGGLGGIATHVGESLAAGDVTEQQLVPNFLKDVGSSLYAAQEHWLDKTSHGAQQRFGFGWTQPGADSAWQAPVSTGILQLVRSIGSSAPTVAALASGGGIVARIAAGVMEGSIAAGMGANDIKEEVLGMDAEQVRHLPAFQEALARGATMEEAKLAVANAAAGEMLQGTFGTTAALSAAGAGLGGAWAGRQASRWGRTKAGAVAEAVPEAAQGIGEEYWAARAAQRTFDPERQPDYLEAGVSGALLGGAMGAAGGAMSPAPGRQQPTPVPEQQGEFIGPPRPFVGPPPPLVGPPRPPLPQSPFPRQQPMLPPPLPQSPFPRQQPLLPPPLRPEPFVGPPREFGSTPHRPSALTTDLTHESPGGPAEGTRYLPLPDGRRIGVNELELRSDPQLRAQALYVTNAPQNLMTVRSEADVELQIDYVMNRLPREPRGSVGMPPSPGTPMPPGGVGEAAPVVTAPERALQDRGRVAQRQAQVLGQAPPTDRAAQLGLPIAGQPGQSLQPLPPAQVEEAPLLKVEAEAEIRQLDEQRAEYQRRLSDPRVSPTQRAQLEDRIAEIDARRRALTGNLGPTGTAVYGEERRGMAGAQRREAYERGQRREELKGEIAEAVEEAAESPSPTRRKLAEIRYARRAAEWRELGTGEAPPRREITEREAAEGRQFPPSKIGLAEKVRRRRRRLAQAQKHYAGVREMTKPTEADRKIRAERVAATKDRIKAQAEESTAREAARDALAAFDIAEQEHAALLKEFSDMAPRRQYKERREIRRQLAEKWRAMEKAEAEVGRREQALAELTEVLELARTIEQQAIKLHEQVQERLRADLEAAKELAPPLPQEPEKIKGVGKIQAFEEKVKAAAKRVVRDEALLQRVGQSQPLMRAFLDPASPMRASGENGDKARRLLLDAMQAVAEKIDPKTNSKDRAVMEWAMQQIRNSSEEIKADDLRDFGEEQRAEGMLPEGLNLDMEEEIEVYERQVNLGVVRPTRALPVPQELTTAKDEMLNLAGIRRRVGSVMDGPARDMTMLRGFLRALPVMEHERPGAIEFFEKAFGSMFELMPAEAAPAQAKQVIGKREVLGEEKLDFTGEVKAAAKTPAGTTKVYKRPAEIMDLAFRLIDKYFTQDVRRQVKPIRDTKKRYALHLREQAAARRLADEMRKIVARAEGVADPIQRRIDAMQMARNMIKRQEEFTSPTGQKRTRISRWAAFKKARKTDEVAKEIAEVARAAGFDAHADALVAAKAHPRDLAFYDGVAKRTRDAKARKLVKDWLAEEEAGRKEVLLTKAIKFAIVKDLVAAMNRDMKAQEQAIKDAQNAAVAGTDFVEVLAGLPELEAEFDRARQEIEAGEVAVRDELSRAQRLDTLMREHIVPLREAADKGYLVGVGANRRFVHGQEILDRIEILANYLTATGSNAGLGIVDAKDNLIVRDPNTVNKATITAVVDDVINKALLGLQGAVESEYVSNQPKESTADPDEAPVDADTFAAREALLDESGRPQDTDEPGGGNQRGRAETPVVYLSSQRVPLRSQLHEEFASLEFDEDQIPAIEAINEALRTGPGFLLNDEQGFGKTVEMLAGAVQTIINGDGIVPVKKKGRPHRIVVITPVAENFREDAQSNKFGVQPLLDKYGIEVVLTKTGSQNVEDADMRTLSGEPAGKLKDYATQGYDILLFDEVHKFATPDPVSPAFKMLWDFMRDKQANGVQPKVVFSTGTFADKERNSWPLAFIEGMEMSAWWRMLGVRAEIKTSSGKRELKIKAPEGMRTTPQFRQKVMDRIEGIMQRMATEYKIVRREMDAPSIEEMSTPVDTTELDQGLDDIAEAVGIDAKDFRALVAKTQSNITRAGVPDSPDYEPKASPDQQIYLAETLKIPIAARQAAEAVQAGQRPIVMVNQVNPTRFGMIGERSGMPLIDPPKLFENLFRKYLEELNVNPTSEPVGHFWKGDKKRKGYAEAGRMFQRGGHQVLFASYAKASEGQNLHDGEGTAEGQRVLIMTQLSNDYKQQLQASKRVIRRGQRSDPVVRLLFNEQRFEADGHLGGRHARAEGLYNTLTGRKEAQRGRSKKESVGVAPYFTREIPGVHVDERHVKLTGRLEKKEKQLLGRKVLQEVKVRQLFFGPENEHRAVSLGDDLQFHVLDNKGSTKNIDAFYKQLDRYMKGMGYEKAKGYDPVQGMVPSGPDLANAVEIMTSAQESAALMKPVNRRVKKFVESLPGLNREATVDDILDVIADGDEPIAQLARALRQLNLQVPIRFDVREIESPALYDVDTRSILVKLGAQGRRQFAHLMMHEILHAATIHGMRADPSLRRSLAPIYEQAWQQAIERGLVDAEIVDAMRSGRTLTREQRRQLANQGLYGLSNLEEFVSEAFLSPQMQELLTHESESGQRTLMQRIWDSILGWLDRLFGTQMASSKPVQSLMDELQQMRSTLFQTEEEAARSWADSREFAGPPAAFELGDQASKLIDTFKIGRRKYVDPYINLPRADVLRRRTAEVYYKSRTDLLNEGRTYARDDELNDLFDAFVREKDQQVQEAMRMTKGSEDLIERWDNEVAKNPSKMNRLHDLMAHSTLQEMFLDKEYNDSAHDHLRKFERKRKDGTTEVVLLSSAQIDGARQRFEKLKREFEAADFSKDQVKIYQDAYAATRVRWDEITTSLIENILRVYAPKASQSTLEQLTQQLRGRTRLPDTWQALSADGSPMQKQDGKEAKAQRRKLARILAQTKARGPYFPLRRKGRLVVSAEKEWKDEFFPTKTARKERMKELYAADRTIKFRTDKVGGMFILRPYEYAVEMFDTMDEALDFQSRMDAAGFQTKDPQKRRDFSRRKGVLTGTDLDRALKDLPENSKERQAVIGFFLDMYPGTSIRHALQHRKNVRGADPEMSQAFAQYIHASSYHMAQLKHGHRIAKALKNLRNYVTRAAGGGLSFRDPKYTYQMDTIVSELERREDDYQLEHEQVLDYAGKINRFMFLYTLAQPGFLLMNATQVPLATAPVLAGRFGLGPAQRVLSDSFKAIMPDFMRRLRGTTGAIFARKPERAFFEFLEDRNGQLSPGQEFISNIQRSNLQNKGDVIRAVTELGEMGRLDLTLSAVVQQAKHQTGTKTSRWVNNFMELARGPVQVVETGNRVWTGVAAYTLYRNKHEAQYRKNGKLANLHRDSVAYAAQIIDETQVNYSEADAPRWMARSGIFGSFAPVLFMYKRYAHYMHMNFIRNAYRAINTEGLSDDEVKAARKSVALLTASHVAAAGALGLPQLAKMTAALAFTMFKDEEDPRNFDEWARAGLAEAFGDLGGEVIAHGLPRLLNVDMSASLGLDNAFLFTDELRGRHGEDWLKEFGYLLGGPAIGVAGRLLTIPEFMEKGEYWRAAELVAPKALRNFMQAARYSEEGVTDRSGDVIRVSRDIDGWELLQRSIGLQSGTTAEFYDGRSAVTAARRFFTQKRKALLARYRGGARGPALMRDIEDYNNSVPSPGLKITPSTLEQIGRRSGQKAESQYGLSLPRSQQGLESYGAWANL